MRLSNPALRALTTCQEVRGDQFEAVDRQRIVHRIAGVELLNIHPNRTRHQPTITPHTLVRNFGNMLSVVQQRDRIQRRAEHQHPSTGLHHLLERRPQCHTHTETDDPWESTPPSGPIATTPGSG